MVHKYGAFQYHRPPTVLKRSVQFDLKISAFVLTLPQDVILLFMPSQGGILQG